MTTVLHISTAGPTWWKKTPTGWDPTSEPTQGYAGVVTDLAEETFAEITVPRIFGADRANYVQRQLQSRFPETSFRIALPVVSAGSFMERLAPPRQAIAGVEPGERIQSALQGLQVSVAGVWSTSLLLAQLGKKAPMPADLFIVLCQPQSMRILFLKQRSPVLTRLITATESAPEQAAEIVRTLRHLENTHVIERESQRFGLLLLGAAPGLAQALVGERLDPVAPPAPWNKAAVADWNHVLFDMAVKNPTGQLAPVSYRATYVARKWAQAAQLAGALCIAATVWLAGGSINSALQAYSARAALQADMKSAAAKVATTDSAIQILGVTPELVRKAVTLDSAEITSAPSMHADMVRLSRVIGAVPGVQLKSMQWQLLGAGDKACADGAAASAPRPQAAMGTEPAAGAAMGTQPAAQAEPARKVELQFSLQVPEGTGPRLLAQQAAEISRQLASTQGIRLLQDPTRRLRQGVIKAGGVQAQTDGDIEWCATLEGKP
jgi:hypothetical protein